MISNIQSDTYRPVFFFGWSGVIGLFLL
uniref:Uncharacterized protein n=1 Tax=Rhizophora mucronata TaxID=61149 RepID=A0A2P2IJR4_RHIMU